MDQDTYHQRLRERTDEVRTIKDIIGKGGYCVLCGFYDEPRVIRRVRIFQDHHISGKKNSDVTISVCPTCHTILSNGQMSWPKCWTEDNNPDMLKVALQLQGLSDIAFLQSRLLKQSSEKIMEGYNE